ncbi:cysteine hydrolase family protein [Isoptericola variabilis]|uniref:Isochorismatase hydrolase n=1 Tax=Isoptericola variabilis (strain 225) TaxID=743718 RepID=F6FTM3_ISOV2|nr:cysteine hydrolase [Isoptericola variabilis]AEG44150.1 isochorismatase hydrolase [Isoptericola variabilis 225]TWH28536.1 nicotinamidase-related amidase [Isoptericola variabilis J7]
MSLVDDGAWLVVVDMQNVFAHPPSPWASPDYPTALAGTRRLVDAFGDRVVFTRYVAPAEPEGAWRAYFALWPFALVPPDAPLYDLVDELDPAGRQVVTRTTFGKWGPELDAATHGAADLVLAGVSTDCCVLSTALPAADAGRRVHVAADACAGASRADHERALDAMRLYAPLVEVTTTAAVLGAP